MTCIAWDGKTLAADKRATNCDLARTVTKIFRLGRDTLAGMSGSDSVAREMLEWFKAGAKRDDFPKAAVDGVATLLVIRRDSLVVYTIGPMPTPFEDKQFAIGSGRDYALAAMHLGVDACGAVAVACRFDVGCGNGIDVLEFDQ